MTQFLTAITREWGVDDEAVELVKVEREKGEERERGALSETCIGLPDECEKSRNLGR